MHQNDHPFFGIPSCTHNGKIITINIDTLLIQKCCDEGWVFVYKKPSADLFPDEPAPCQNAFLLMNFQKELIARIL